MKRVIAAIVAVFTIGVLYAAPTQAMDLFNDCQGSDCAIVKDNGLQQGNSNFAVKNIINNALAVLAALCVLMIVVGGLRIAISNGDASAVTWGKMSILYSVIGLGVAVFSYAIVNFVVANVLK